MTNQATMAKKSGTTSLRLLSGSREQFERIQEDCAGRILGVLAYSVTKPSLPDAFPCAWIELPVLGATEWYEVWITEQPPILKHDGKIEFSCDGALLFGSLTLPEGDTGNLESIAFDAYSAIFDMLDREGYPELLRVWNYFPRINDIGDQLERYREFNVGRHEAFFDKRRTIGEGSVPAACALGTQRGNLVACFIAGKAPGITIENPRQVNAYYYSSDFGPRSPTFSRGVLVGDMLLISGTASIIGSETVHRGNVLLQLDETLENLRVVIGKARECGFTTSNLRGLLLNVYLRHAEDYAGVRTRLDAEFDSTTHIVYLQADVCRTDLLIEVEAFWLPGP